MKLVKKKLNSPERNKFPWFLVFFFYGRTGVRICFKYAICRDADSSNINLLQPTGHVMHHQFNIQQLYALPTQYLCVLYLSENK